MATREDYKAGAIFLVTSDCANFAKGALIRPYTVKDDGSNSPGFITADHEGEVGYENWDYEDLKHLQVVTAAPATESAVNVADALKQLHEDVEQALATMADLAPAFQSMLLTGISAECLRVAELLKKSIK